MGPDLEQLNRGLAKITDPLDPLPFVAFGERHELLWVAELGQISAGNSRLEQDLLEKRAAEE